MPKTIPKWYYFYAGLVERGAKYEWREGYSRLTASGMEFPWLTKREAQSAAKKAGARAVFFRSQHSAAIALDGEKIMANPNAEAFKILKTLTQEQRGALAHLLNNALAPVVIEVQMLQSMDWRSDCCDIVEAAEHLRDTIHRIIDGD